MSPPRGSRAAALPLPPDEELSVSLALADNPRSAHATIRGYTYQVLLTVLRWFALREDEMLICEAVEDLDLIVLGDGVSTSFQDKRLAGRISARSESVHKTIRGFLTSYVAIRKMGSDRRFVFTSTAAMARQRGEFDLLRRWNDRSAAAGVIESVKALVLATDGNGDDEVKDAISWLDGRGEWSRWIGAVEWKLGAPDETRVLDAIEQAARCHPGVEELPPGAVRDRLFVEVILASGRQPAAARQLDRARLDLVLVDLRGSLDAWIASPQGAVVARLLQPLALANLLMRDQQWRIDMPPASLLRPGYRVQPFDGHGREAALAQIQLWCTAERRWDVLLVLGDGGVGKTRMLLEVCAQYSAQGWLAGFIRHNLLDRQIALLDWGATDVLVVVDYAETRTQFVKELLRQVAAKNEDRQRIRVVLVARRGPADSEWWQEVLLSDSDLYDNLAQVGHVALTPLYLEHTDRLAAFHAATHVFADRLNRPSPALEALPDLTDDRFASPLYVQLAALAGVFGTPEVTPQQALDVVLQHERHFWRRAVEVDSPPDSARGRSLVRALTRCAALLTLTGGSPTRAACRELLSSQVTDDADLDWCIFTLRSTYGDTGSSEDRYISPLEPDLLGEHLVAQQLSEDANLIQAGIGHSIPAAHIALTTLNRLAARGAAGERWVVAALADGSLRTFALAMRVATESGDPMGRILATVVGENPLPERDEELLALVPIETVALREFAEAAARSALELEANGPGFPESRVGALNRHASYLRGLGRFSDALNALGPALATSADSIEGAHEVFHARVSHALLLADIGHLSEGATALAKALAEKPPGLRELEEWNALNNFGCLLSRTERDKEAAAVHRNNKDLLERSIGPREGREKYLITTLINLANALDRSGESELALIEARRATKLADAAAAHAPDGILPDLSLALHATAGVLSSLGRDEEAEPILARAVAIRTQLARARPQAFMYVLAGSLGNLSNLHGRRGQPQSGLQLSNKAIECLRSASDLEPRAMSSRLAHELSHRAEFLLELEEFDEAALSAEEALSLYDELIVAGDAQWYRVAASTLDRLVSGLVLGSRANQAADASRAFADRALPDAEKHRAASVARARGLVSLAKCYGELQLMDPAYEPLLEASWRCVVALHEPEEEPGPTRLMYLEVATEATVLLARILITRRELSSACLLLTMALGFRAGDDVAIGNAQRADAVMRLVACIVDLEADDIPTGDAASVALESLDRLLTDGLSEIAPDLVEVGMQRMRQLSEAGEAQEALDLGIRLIPIAAGLRYREDRLLNSIGICLTQLGRDDQAVVASALAVDAARNSRLLDAGGDSALAMVLQSYAVDLSRVGEFGSALSVFEEAARLYSSLLPSAPLLQSNLEVLLRFYRRAALDAGVELPREIVDPIEADLWVRRLSESADDFLWEAETLALGLHQFEALE